MGGEIVTIGRATLYLGDCRDILPTLPKVDAVITDPPFGVDFAYNSHDDCPDAYPAFMREVVALTQPLVGDGPSVFWQGMPNADRWHTWFPSGFRLFAACKGFVQFRPTPVQYSWDPVVFWGAPRGEPAAGRRDWHTQMLAPFGAGRERVNHPCPRPLEQVEYVVETFTEAGDIILDPFLGSGTTAVAALRTGRSVIGCELDRTYFETACERVRRAAGDDAGPLFGEAALMLTLLIPLALILGAMVLFLHITGANAYREMERRQARFRELSEAYGDVPRVPNEQPSRGE